VRTADNLTTFMCRMSWNLGASTSWNPLGLSRSVMGLLFFFNAQDNFIAKNFTATHFNVVRIPQFAKQYSPADIYNGSSGFSNHFSFQGHATDQWYVTGFLLHTPGFRPGNIRFFTPCTSVFPLSVPFHKCSTPVLIYLLLLTEWQMGEVWET